MFVANQLDHVLTSRQEQPSLSGLGRDPNHPIWMRTDGSWLPETRLRWSSGVG